MGQTLRPYQEEALEAVQRQFDRGVEATIVSLFTGLGKTNLFIEDVYRRMRKDSASRTFVIGPAHLIDQTYQRFLRTYPEIFGGYVQAGHKRVRASGIELANKSIPDARLIVGSVPTLIDRIPEDLYPITKSDIQETPYGGVKLKGSARRVLVSERMDTILAYGLPEYLIYDETHHAVADGSLLLINRVRQICHALGRPAPKIVGYTATAWREDGRGLDNVFQTIAIHRGYDFGVKNGFLAPLATPIRIHADLGESIAAALKVRDWMELIQQGWEEKARDSDGSLRPTVAYFKTVQHSIEFAKFLREQGINAAHIDGEQTIDGDGVVSDVRGREKVFQDVFSGKTRMVCNYGVILEGTDLPPLSCIIWARPTDNAVLITQAIGRVLRKFEGNTTLPGKQDALIIDVTGRDINVLSAGSLAGFKVDPLSDQYEDTEAEEMTLMEGLEDGKDLRDVGKNMAQTSQGIRYSFARIIQKSGSVWFHDDKFDILSLSISEKETLIVTPPHYTYKSHLDSILDQLQPALLNEPDNEQLLEDFQSLSELSNMLGGYCLWSVIDKEPIRGYLAYDSNLDVVLDRATIYMGTHDSVNAFYNRRNHWRNQPQTDAQRGMLKRLAPKEDTSYLTCGQASQKISHILAYEQRLAKYLAKKMLSVQKYLQAA